MPDNRELAVLDIALTLYDGENKAGLVCPACNGGRTNEGSFSVSRDNHHVYFICHRSSCGYRGRIRTSGAAAAERKQQDRSHREYVTDPEPVPVEDVTKVKDRYRLSEDEYNRAGFGSTAAHSPAGSRRLWVPVCRRDGSVRGYIARDLTGTQGKKALNFKWRTEDTFIGWYNNRESKKVVLVEDCFSALRLSTYINAVNLCGVHVSEDCLDELTRAGFREAYLCLDKDAVAQAVRLALKHRGRFPLKVVPLPMDAKDMSREDLEAFVKEKLT